MAKQRKRRSDLGRFIDVIGGLSDSSGGGLVGNGAVQKELGWTDDKYKKNKDQLIQNGEVIIGRGGGGTIGIKKTTRNEPLKLFISYSHLDEDRKKQLLKHLKPLERNNLIDAWHDRKINAGDNWGDKIASEINDADIVLLLISIDFINSGYCYEIELDRALERHEQNECRVIPVILRNCIWQSLPIAKIQVLPKDALSVASWANEEDALVDVALGIEIIAKEMKIRSEK